MTPSTAEDNRIPALRLTVLPREFSVCRLPPDEALPSWVPGLPFWSATRTADELSLVLPADRTPEGWQAEYGWRCLAVQGPLDFSLVGVMARLSTALAAAGVSLFAISTYDTDYLLVRTPDLEKALQALRSAGCSVNSH